MKQRRYVVSLQTDDFARKQIVEDKLKEYGRVSQIGQDGGVLVSTWDVEAKEGLDSKTIRDGIRPSLSVFEDVLFVARYNKMDSATVNATIPESADAKNDGDIDGKRNFNRFGTRQEAKAAYERERPNWWVKYGGGSAVPVMFEEWLWLPIRKDGVYERGENEKYL